MTMGAMAAKTGLSLLAMLVGLLQDGTRELEAEDHVSARQVFRKATGWPGGALALCQYFQLWEGIARGRAGRLGGGGRVYLGDPLRTNGDVRALSEAFATFAALGGDPRAALPKETPKQAFQRIRDAGAKGDLLGFRRDLSGMGGGMLGAAERFAKGRVPGGVTRQIQQFCHDAKYVSGEVGKGEEMGLAKVTATLDHGRLSLTFRLVARGNNWSFDTILVAAKRGETVAPTVGVGLVGAPTVVKACPKSVETQVPGNLIEGGNGDSEVAGAPLGEDEKRARKEAYVREQITLSEAIPGLLLSVRAYGVYPKTLDGLQRLTGKGDSILMFTDPATGRKLRRLYHYLGKADEVARPQSTFVLATPVPIYGKRIVLFVDGHTAGIPEAQFLKEAKAQGWLVSGDRVVTVKELKAKVDALVMQLGAAKASHRQEAYRELKRFAKYLIPLLEAHSKHPDPEIRLSVQELLREGRKAESPTPSSLPIK